MKHRFGRDQIVARTAKRFPSKLSSHSSEALALLLKARTLPRSSLRAPRHIVPCTFSVETFQIPGLDWDLVIPSQDF